MPTFADGESLATVRTKINDAITTVDALDQGVATTDSVTFAELTVSGDSVTIATSKTPASATDTGTTGEVAWDANYIYVCTATNTWVRAALATW